MDVLVRVTQQQKRQPLLRKQLLVYYSHENTVSFLSKVNVLLIGSRRATLVIVPLRLPYAPATYRIVVAGRGWIDLQWNHDNNDSSCFL